MRHKKKNRILALMTAVIMTLALAPLLLGAAEDDGGDCIYDGSENTGGGVF